MPKVTDRKLVAASRALLTLAQCDDLDERVWNHRDAWEALNPDDRCGLDELDRHAPKAEHVVRMANILSSMAVPDAP